MNSVNELRDEIQRRKSELELLEELHSLVGSNWPAMVRLADITKRNPKLLPQGLVIYGREMPDLPQHSVPITVPDLVPRSRRFTRRAHRYAGALRIVMETIDKILGENAPRDITIPRAKIREQIEPGLLPDHVFSNTISNAVSNGILEYTDDTRDYVRVRDAGWDRIRMYKDLPRHRVKLSQGTVPETQTDAVLSDTVAPAPEEEMVPVLVEAAATLIPLTEDAILKCLPASREEIEYTLSGVGYDTSNLRTMLGAMHDTGKIHRAAGEWHLGPTRDKTHAERKDPADDFPQIILGQSPKNPEDYVRLDFRASTLQMVLEIGCGPARSMNDVHREIMRRYKLTEHDCAKEQAYLRAAGFVTCPSIDTIKLTAKGKALYHTGMELRAREATRKNPIPVG
jgi:hypothetical protein